MSVEQISREAAYGAALLAKSVEIALQAVDLSPSQYRLLTFLAEAPSAATALAARLDVTRPSLTALVDGLVARGYVERLPDPNDRRRVSHEISKAGRTALAEADQAIQGRLSQLATPLSPAARSRANAGLEDWLAAIAATRAAKAKA